MERSRGLRASEITALPWRGGASTQNRIARRRAEPGWRAAVLDEGASRHAFRLRATEEGSGSRAPASASGASNAIRNEPTPLSSASDDEVGDFAARSDLSGASHEQSASSKP